MVCCCVPFCKSNPNYPTTPRTSFHEFPCDEQLRRQWLRRIARKDFIINDRSPSSVVCSKHFTQNDYRSCPFGYEFKTRRLKKQAVPTVFPMYPSYALFPAPDNYLSLGNINPVKKTSIVKDPPNSRKKAVIDVAGKPDRNSSNSVVEQQHVKRVTIKKEKEEAPAANNSCSFDSLNPIKKTSIMANASEIIPVAKIISSDMTSTNKNSREEQQEERACKIKKAKYDLPVANNCSSIRLSHVKGPSIERTESSTKIIPIDISVHSDMTSTNNNLREQQGEDLACAIKKAKNYPSAEKINRVKRLSLVAAVTKNSTKTAVNSSFKCNVTLNTNSQEQLEDHVFMIKNAKRTTQKANKRSCVSLDRVKRRSTVQTVTENCTRKIPVDITINSEITSKNNIIRKQQSRDHVFMIKKAKKDTTTANNNPSYVSFNQVKSSSMVEDETQRSTNKASINTISKNISLVKLQHEDRVSTKRKKATEEPPAANNKSSYVSFNQLKSSSTVVDETQKSTNKSLINTIYKNSSLVKLQHEDRVSTKRKKATEEPPAANNNSSYVSFNQLKSSSTMEDETQKSTNKALINTISKNSSLVNLQHEDRVSTKRKKVKEDPPAANNNSSSVILIYLKKSSSEGTVIENSRKIDPMDMNVNSEMTSTNNDSVEQHHKDSESVNKETNNSIEIVLQTKIKDQQMQIKDQQIQLKRLRNFLQKKNQKLKLMKEEMDMMKKKITFYKKNEQYKILRKALAH